MAAESMSTQPDYEDRSNLKRSNGADQKMPLAIDPKGIAITCATCGLVNFPASTNCSRCNSRLSLTDITVQFPMSAPQHSSSPTGPLIGPDQTVITLEAEE